MSSLRADHAFSPGDAAYPGGQALAAKPSLRIAVALAVWPYALAAQPDVVAKVRAGNLGPVGAIIGAVMKATKGQADAGRVRALVVERIGAGG